MNPTKLSMVTLGITIIVSSIWWVSISLKEGKKAIEESKKEAMHS